MDLSFSPAQVAFRAVVREWIQSAMPPEIKAIAAVDGSFHREEMMTWHKILYRKGWVAAHWPKEVGGPGLDVTERFILSEELELAGAPYPQPVRPGNGGAALDPVRQRRAKEALSAEDPER